MILTHHQQLTEIHFIDYEFSGLNFLGYEFGNLFNELASEYEPEFQFFEERIPKEKIMVQFLGHYLWAKQNGPTIIN